MGRVTVNFNKLESVLRLVLGTLYGREDVAAVLLAGARFDPMLRMARRLIPVRVSDEQLREALLGWLDLASRANQGRVEIIHSNWITFDTAEGEEPLPPLRVRFTSGGRSVGHPSAEEIERGADLIYEAARLGANLWEQLESNLTDD